MLEQDHAQIRPSVRVGSRKRHRIRIVDLAVPGFRIPSAKQLEGFVNLDFWRHLRLGTHEDFQAEGPLSPQSARDRALTAGSDLPYIDDVEGILMNA
jgi:hypothetical protein